MGEMELVIRKRDSAGNPQMAETALQRYLEFDTIPNDSFFIVHHYDPPPAGAAASGMIAVRAKNGKTHTVIPEGLAGLPTRQVLAVLECAGNGRKHLRTTTPGTQFDRGLCGVAAWEGVPLLDLLESQGVDTDFRTLVVRGLDRGWAAPENVHAQFAKGLPQEKGLHPDTLLAWSMNGEPIPHAHGGPLRLVVPGWAGVWWVKWPCAIECNDDDFHGFWQHERYRYLGGEYETPQVVTEQLPRALITTPVDNQILLEGTTQIAGKAWSGGGPIERVEVSGDGGLTWHDARLEEPRSQWDWVTWTVALPFAGVGVATICARATDGRGTNQTWDSRRNDLGYGNNDIMSVSVRIRPG